MSTDDSFVWYAESRARVTAHDCVTIDPDDVYTTSLLGDLWRLAAEETAESVSVTERREPGSEWRAAAVSLLAEEESLSTTAVVVADVGGLSTWMTTCSERGSSPEGMGTAVGVRFGDTLLDTDRDLAPLCGLGSSSYMMTLHVDVSTPGLLGCARLAPYDFRDNCSRLSARTGFSLPPARE